MVAATHKDTFYWCCIGGTAYRTRHGVSRPDS